MFKLARMPISRLVSPSAVRQTSNARHKPGFQEIVPVRYVPESTLLPEILLLIYRERYMRRLYGFEIASGAKIDLRDCKEQDAFAAAYLATFLRELVGGERSVETMIDEHYADDEIVDICQVATLQQKRINAYRVKLVSLRHWRLIFAVDHPTKRIALMAVMHRDKNYEQNVQLWNDIEREYDDLGFARY